MSNAQLHGSIEVCLTGENNYMRLHDEGGANDSGPTAGGLDWN